jgi:hypothetical protein
MRAGLPQFSQDIWNEFCEPPSAANEQAQNRVTVDPFSALGYRCFARDAGWFVA